MKRNLLLILFITLATLGVSAATKYEINVAGVEVTSDNANRITGGDITSGYAVYNASSNTLTLYNISINRNGQDKYGIHNRKCDNLKIVFTGNCYIITADNALKLERGTTLNAASGSNVTLYSSARICANLKSYNYYITGSGRLYFDAEQSGYEAIKGDGTGSTNVYFQGAKVTAHSSQRSALSSFAAYLQGGTDLTIEGNGSNASVSSVSMSFVDNTAILEPYGAYYSNNSVYNSSGNQIKSGNIYISDNYVAIFNSSYFPDVNFRSYLLGLYSKGYITTSDVESSTSLSPTNKGITSLQGIGYFSKLTSLDCSGNNLTSLPSLPTTLSYLNISSNKFTSIDLHNYSSLKTLNCSNNQISSLNNFPYNIEYLDCSNNKFTSLNFDNINSYGYHSGTKYTKLKTLICKNNTLLTELYFNFEGSTISELSSIDFSGCSNLKQLVCPSNKISLLSSLPSSLKTLNVHQNQLTSLPSLPSGLEMLQVSSNRLTSFSLSNHSNIKTIYLYNNPITTIQVIGNVNLTNLFVYETPTLITLNCYGNGSLTALNVDGCTGLKTLDCHANRLASLGTLPASLQTINCRDNKLTSLNVSNRTALQNLDCGTNLLNSLNVQNCSGLKTLKCDYNRLSSLSVQGCSSLTQVYLYWNQIKESGMNTLVNSLRTIPSGSTGFLGVLYPNYSASGIAEGNVITDVQVTIARNKRWIPKQYDHSYGSWVDIPINTAIPGDVNGDGEVTGSDVTALYNYLLFNDSSAIVNGDQNGDGDITGSDVTAVYNILLGL